ncbi:MAG: two-component system sensor histidine kinase CreC [Rhodocyclales bacterium]|nr:two-component system sensor histidine kinase CreC [Rhodocyclales bacterium]MBI5786908.1 two-component system sensor histidine kinase CreC [Rhodocyclales bacterium]
MKLWARVFLGYFVIVGLAGWFVLRVFVNEVKPGVREAVEEVMVDSAHLVAELARDELASGHLDNGRFRAAIDAYRQRSIRASIWGRDKMALDLRIYVTDDKGIVRFDSEGKAVGQDYSQWRDVARTLRGEYGARSTRDDPEEATSGVLYVAAPVMRKDRIVGVATVAKPVAALQPIIERSQRTVFLKGLLLLAAALLIGIVFTVWLTLSFGSLLRYARALARGEQGEPPSRGQDEIGELSRALASLRQEVDGRAYVEQYVQHLTHEMKSPLSAIRGAGELLAEPMSDGDRRRFADSVIEQSRRLQAMVDRLLRLAQLEQKRELTSVEPVPLSTLFDAMAQRFDALAARRGIGLGFECDDGATVAGDRFLLEQALAALVENALDFSVAGQAVRVCAVLQERRVSIEVRDSGPGIPEYARNRIFERFFSLPRPNGGSKSTGLGLALAREVALLHHGSVDIENRTEGGVCARLVLPVD